jgi:two-component system OmpR family response regulator
MRIHKPTAIIVDEDLDLASLVTTVLNENGFTATQLADPALLPKLVERLNPDVVLIDIKGYSDDKARDAVAWLDQHRDHIPVVMFTTSAEMARSVGVTPGGKKFVKALLKPFSQDELIRTLRQAIARQAPSP